jgi:hypothetical protein
MVENIWAIINLNYDFLIIKIQDEFVMLFYFIKQYTNGHVSSVKN